MSTTGNEPASSAVPARQPASTDGRPALRFRDAMAAVCTPVTVVTAMDGERPHGTTVSAFASLSVGPPMVIVALDLGSDLLALIRATGRFGVNVLGSDQSEMALNFARKGAGKFDGLDWAATAGLPRLAGAPIWLVCEVSELVSGGDHIIVLGLVTELEKLSKAPLTYYARSFGTHRRHPA